MECKRCGADEDRINGYCSHYCEDMHELEQELEPIRKAFNSLETTFIYSPLVDPADAIRQMDRRLGELKCRVNDLERRLRDANEVIYQQQKRLIEARDLIEKVEWVMNSQEDSSCPWCYGEEPGNPPERDWYDEEDDFLADFETWQSLGHKPYCKRQKFLKEE